ncbi:MAG: cobalt ECF transporter T component CbiQ [Oscillibacter sp.]|nr:cobalt ECF transporter T component CbiQ [Oscillibacter sp.]
MANLSSAMKSFCLLEQLAEGNSPLHRLHPGAKLAITLVYVVCVISFPASSLSALVPFTAYPIVAMALSGTPWKPLLQRIAVAMPFVLFTALSNLLLNRRVLYFLGPLPVTGGLLACLSIVLKAFLTVGAVLVLIATTSMETLTGQLVRLHVPKILCLQLTMTYRYISVLIQQAQRMYAAYQLRSCGKKGIQMRDMGCFLGQLLLRSFDQAERIYCAMKCRGYDGTYHAECRWPVTARDAEAACVASAAFLLLRVFNLSVLLGKLI